MISSWTRRKRQKLIWVDEDFHENLKKKAVRENKSMLEITRGLNSVIGGDPFEAFGKKKRR